METASNRDLAQFRRWYSQAGTPHVDIIGDYNKKKKQFTLTVTQTNTKDPLHIPLAISLIDQNGSLPLVLTNNSSLSNETREKSKTQDSMVLDITEAQQIFIFDQVDEAPVPLLFQGFSAPVKWTYDYSFEDLLLILSVAGNDYSRWEASQLLWTQLIDQTIDNQTSGKLGKSIEIPEAIIALFSEIDQGLAAKMLTLPSEAYLTEMAQPSDAIDVEGIHNARCSVQKQLAIKLKERFQAVYGRYETEEPVSITPAAMANRALRNVALHYLMETGDSHCVDVCYDQFVAANNMTDTMAALTCLVNSEADCARKFKQQALDAFYDQWQDQPLVVNQWFEVQACCHLPGTLAKVKALLHHPAFDIKSPNQVRALIGSFCTKNAANFHNEDGSGYQFLVDQIITLNTINPQMASRTLAWSPLINWKRYDSDRQQLMKYELERLQNLPNLSSEVAEVVDKCL